MNKNEIEPAFPVVAHMAVVSEGMSLRDYFAAQALNGLLSSLNFITNCGPKNIAALAYSYADAMLEQRDK